METVMIIFLILVLAINIFILLRVLKPEGRDNRRLEDKMTEMQGTINSLTQVLVKELQINREELSKSVKSMQDGNERKLEQMRETVDEKLQATVEKRFTTSFATISRQLTEVHNGLGEMKNLATGVGDLKKVMEGVKTRGIYGEVGLSAIISDILPRSQYAENIATKKGSNDRVEFAIKLPGKDEKTIYLPIDSKFPIENYQRLLDAYDKGEKILIEKYRKALETDIKAQAKKISTKYVDPPYTTNYAMLFLPTESLYAEIYRIPGLAEEIRSNLNIVIVSPSTLPMVLNGLLTGFRTLAIEKRSSEVWETLGAVKTQFGKFGDLLDGVQKKLEDGAKKIDEAKKTSRKIEKHLSDVETLPEDSSNKLLEI